MSLRIVHEARTETQHAAEWYEDQRPGLGEDFLEELAANYLKIEEHPLRYTRATVSDLEGHELHRVMLRRFPYKVIYEVRDEAIVVLAVAHGRRKPNYWIERATN